MSATSRRGRDDDAIVVEGLAKSYGKLRAVRSVDLRVERGEVFAFLGPNGAGKTTTVEILEGYRARDAGTVKVLGEDPWRAPRSWRGRIGIVLQNCRMEPEHTVRQTLDLFAGYYPAPRSTEEVMDLVGLTAQHDQRVGKLSGGQQRRLDVGLGLVGRPELVFLDEPTTGFDPAARREAWQMLARLREGGTTVFLTTHYMEEAEALADHAAIIVGGAIRAVGTPSELVANLGGQTEVQFDLPAGIDPAALEDSVGASVEGGRVCLKTAAPQEALELLQSWSRVRGVKLEGLEIRRATLEDVFLEVTARERA
ncbi:MAG: ATP-binding cassette domain-containing protein [Solirubrobacteraceae bacterium]